MGTRSLTVVKDGKEEVMVMYRQYDGYPQGHGKDLKDFLADYRICNGFGSEQSKGKWANGMGCLAAQIVAHFKTEIGGFYLVKGRGHGEEYVYELTETPEHEIALKISDYDKKVIYKGSLKDFDPDKVE